MEVSLVDVPTQPGRGDLDGAKSDYHSCAWEGQAQETEDWREVIYKSDDFLLWIPNGSNWNHLCMEKH